jgi:hypothetical protein
MDRDEKQPAESGREREGFSRRGLLTGAMLGATALLLAGCRGGGDDDDDEGDDD